MYVKHFFQLNRHTIDTLQDMEPNFGYNGFGEFIFYRTYSRVNKEGKQENWADVVQRVIEGTFSIRKNHYLNNMIPWDEPYWQGLAKKMAISMFKMEWLPPGRGLWAMGTDFIYQRGGMALYNCFSGDTEFFMNGHIGKLKNYVNQEVEVITANGKKKIATVRKFGKQKLRKIIFKPISIDKGSFKSNYRVTIEATKNHRWLLEDGTETTYLRPGHRIKLNSDPIDFTDETSQEYIDGFSHGIVFGDGTRQTESPNNYTLRLCKHHYLLNELRKCSTYQTESYPPSYNGDPVINYLSHNINYKQLPDDDLGFNYIKGFINGWIEADGNKDNNIKLDTQNYKAMEWLFKRARFYGMIPIGHYSTNKSTNYGERKAPLNRLTFVESDVTYIVEAIIDKGKEEEVYCVIEPETQSFTLAYGIPTGNCAFTDIYFTSLDADLSWFMDSLMLGVGVGFSPLREDHYQFKNPKGVFKYIIPDSREGWVEGYAHLLRAYMYGASKPIFDFSEIREKGLPINGFGGISSGPEPLKYLYEWTEQAIDRYMTDTYYDSVILKTDLSNQIGCCVVAGNVRRSAEKGDLSIKDPVWMDIKNYNKYPDREAHGWMSNNSVSLEDDEDFEKLPIIAEKIRLNGEPGFNNLRNFPKGRIGKKDNLRKDTASGTNPCITSGTKIYVADGRGFVPISELLNKDTDVFCINDKDEVCIRKMRNPRITGYNQPILKIVFDNGDYIRVTPNHKFMLRDRSFKEARELKQGDSLTNTRRYIPENCTGESYWDKYISVGYTANTIAEHRLIGQNKFNYLFDDEHIHHIDENKLNNNPNNLELKEAIEHLSQHQLNENNSNWSGYTNEDLIKLGVNLCKKLGRRFSKNEFTIIKSFSEYRTRELGSFEEFAYQCADIAEVRNDPIDPRTLRFYIEMVNQGYETEIINEVVKVKKICEACKSEFWIEAVKREQASCSRSCNNTIRDYSKNIESKRKTYAANKEKLREAQLDIYCRIKNVLGREPLKSEWIQACKDANISAEICRKSSPFQSWSSLKWNAKDFNHRVSYIIEDGYETVYNGTVDEFHNFIIGGWEYHTPFGRRVCVGIVSPQCGEIPLESKEVCNISETLPTMCDSTEKWYEACKYATIYCSSVSLLPTHQPETNKVVARNRRIGVSIIDFSGWVSDLGVSRVIKNLRKGYKVIRETNRQVNSEAGVPEAIRVTTIKPGGTVPKLAGKTSGMMYPNFHYMIRRVRVARNHPVHQLLVEANIPYENDWFSHNTDVFEFPVKTNTDVPEAGDVSIWQQAMNLILLQREWADNAVSNTLNFRPKWVLNKHIQEGDIEDKLRKYCHSLGYGPTYNFLEHELYQKDNYEDLRYKITIKWNDDFNHMIEAKIYQFDPRHEENSIEAVLASIAPLTKSVSMLPHTTKGVYRQMPEEGITKEEYYQRLKTIKKIDWSKLSGSDGEDNRYCEGPACELSRGI